MKQTYTYIADENEQRKMADALGHSNQTVESCCHCTRDDNGTDGRYICTRTRNHKGVHAAHWRSNMICAIWSGLNQL